MIEGLHASAVCSLSRARLCGRSRRSCRGRLLRSRLSLACSRTLDREAFARVCVDSPVKLHDKAVANPPAQFCEDGAADTTAYLLEDANMDPPAQVTEDADADLSLQISEDAAAAAAAAFLQRIAPPPPPSADVAAAAAAAFLRRVESRKVADAVGICDMETSRRKRLGSASPAADRRSRRRVRFDLAGVQAHEVVPYGEIYGLHPRDFVFGKGFRMIPAGGDYGFVDFVTASRRSEGVESGHIEDSDDSDHSDDCDISDEDFC